MAVKYMNAAGRPSLQLGRGIDTTTGSPLGVAVIPDQPLVDPNNSGQIVNYDLTIIESSSELEDSLGLSVGAEMRYGLFSASGKFEMREKSQYKSFATYLLAKCDVRNPPIGLFDPKPKPEAAGVRDRGEAFRKAYGDGFVRAAITGGEFYVLMEILHEETSVEKSLAASLQAQYNGFLASAEVNFEMSQESKEKASKSQTRVIQYQASGQGTETSLVADVESALTRLKAFPQIVLENPVAIQVEIAPYDTMPDLQVNLPAQAAFREALDDCARKKLRYRQVLDEIDFITLGSNAELFESPPPDEVLADWKQRYTEAWNEVTAHATAIADGEANGMFVEPQGLPVVKLKRKQVEMGADVIVPNVVSRPLVEAQAELERYGLVPVSQGNEVAEGQAIEGNPVTSQSVEPGQTVATGTEVKLAFDFVTPRYARKWDALDPAARGQIFNAVAVVLNN